MKTTIKSIFAVSLPVLAVATIFQVTILKTYAEAKQLGAVTVNRSPAVEKVEKVHSLKSCVKSYLVSNSRL